MISVGKWTFHSLHAAHINIEQGNISSHTKQRDTQLRKEILWTVEGSTGHWRHITSRNQHENFILQKLNCSWLWNELTQASGWHMPLWTNLATSQIAGLKPSHRPFNRALQTAKYQPEMLHHMNKLEVFTIMNVIVKWQLRICSTNAISKKNKAKQWMMQCEAGFESYMVWIASY